MLAWRTLNLWQRSLGVLMAAIFIAAFALAARGLPLRSLSVTGWLIYGGAIAMATATVLSPGTFSKFEGAMIVSRSPLIVRCLWLAGFIAILLRVLLLHFGV